VAILGGSFDPPTIAHVEIACEIYNNFADVDEVWFIPCGDGREDKNLRTRGIHRIRMLELLLSDLIDECVPIKVNYTLKSFVLDK
jgi:nicotinate-nucleotide adenylyltransferase